MLACYVRNAWFIRAITTASVITSNANLANAGSSTERRVSMENATLLASRSALRLLLLQTESEWNTSSYGELSHKRPSSTAGLCCKAGGGMLTSNY
mmetsp:Transcript_13062/g.26491  ORF Transcript_13062/g.26491 Transcript_13062/m.26491 type:complete len:96 (-) Transcript_13062:1998-2285(-)